MLTDSISVSDRLINGSIGTVKHLDMRSDPFCNTIYVKSANPKAGNSPKDWKFCSELNECVPITAITKWFSLKKCISTVIVERKWFLLILGHAITVHKSQGSTLGYIKCALIHQQEICNSEELPTIFISGSVWHLTICARSHDKVLLLNFELEYIKVNKPVLDEMVQVRKNSLFSWQCPLIELNDVNMYQFERSCNGHLEHFLSGKSYSTYSSLFCFAETSINDSPAKHINEILHDWKEIHEITQHGLVSCYNVSKVNIFEVIDISGVLEVLPIILEKEK